MRIRYPSAIKRRLGMMAAVLTAALGWASAASAAPQTFSSAITLAPGEFVIREQYLRIQSGDDPSAMARDFSTDGVVSVLGYAPTNKLMLFAVLPVLDKRLEFTSNGDRLTRSSSGIGDVRLFGRYTVYRKNFKGGMIRVSPIIGLEMPTGDDNERDAIGLLPVALQLGSGSWDPFAGLLFTYQTLDLEVDAQVSYQVNTRGDNFQFGDVARADASLQYRLWPRELAGRGVPGFFYGVLEANLIHTGKSRTVGITNPNSGGTTLFLAPGLQYATRRWVAEAVVQLPVIQNLNGLALKNEYVIRAGFRVNF